MEPDGTTMEEAGAFYNADLMLTTGALLAGFLLGSLPFSWWIARLVAGHDLRLEGTRNPGATNTWRLAGRAAGALAGILDAAKGAAAVAFAGWLGLDPSLAIWAGAAAVVGHDFSPWLGFRGGKGGATMLGVLACFIFPELLLVLLVWAVAWAALPGARFVASLAALSLAPLFALLSGRVTFPPFTLVPERPAMVVAAAAGLTVLLWARVVPGLRAGRRADA